MLRQSHGEAVWASECLNPLEPRLEILSSFARPVSACYSSLAECFPLAPALGLKELDLDCSLSKQTPS